MCSTSQIWIGVNHNRACFAAVTYKWMACAKVHLQPIFKPVLVAAAFQLCIHLYQL